MSTSGTTTAKAQPIITTDDDDVEGQHVHSTTATTIIKTRHCCGCDSRIATLIANGWLIFGALFYFVIAIIGLNDHTSSAPTYKERIMLYSINCISIIQIIIASIAFWGAKTYRQWPIKISIGYIMMSVTILVVTMILTMNPFLAIGIAIQMKFIFQPQYSYLEEIEKGILKKQSNDNNGIYEVVGTTSKPTEKMDVELV